MHLLSWQYGWQGLPVHGDVYKRQTPMTVATEAWYTGFHPYTLEPVFSAKTQREKLAQREFFFWYKPEERRNMISVLRRIGRTNLIDKLYGKR